MAALDYIQIVLIKMHSLMFILCFHTKDNNLQEVL